MITVRKFKPIKIASLSALAVNVIELSIIADFLFR